MSSENRTKGQSTKKVGKLMPLCALKGKRIPICAFMYNIVPRIEQFLRDGWIHKATVIGLS